MLLSSPTFHDSLAIDALLCRRIVPLASWHASPQSHSRLLFAPLQYGPDNREEADPYASGDVSEAENYLPRARMGRAGLVAPDGEEDEEDGPAARNGYHHHHVHHGERLRLFAMMLPA